jgi:UDP-N-acetyl-D-glucosamine dehydrogenase
MGVSYRQDVGDTRQSPSEIFAKEANKKGALLDYHDSLVTHWSEMNSRVHSKLPEASNYDAIVFAVQHGQYLKINFADWFKESKPFVFDSNNVLSSSQRQAIKALGCPIGQIGRGENS